MMDMSWWNSTTNWSNRNSIWKCYTINIVELVVIRMLVQN